MEYDKQVWVAVFFLDRGLHKVHLSFFLPDEVDQRITLSSYPDSDLRRYLLHNTLLEEEFGESPYNFPWGFITLGYTYENYSAISIRYF
jgi:hypothetical protein